MIGSLGKCNHRVLRIYTTNLNYPTNHWLPTLQITAARTLQTIMSHQILESMQVPAFYMMIIYSNFHDLVASRYRFEYVDNCNKLGILNQTNDYMRQFYNWDHAYASSYCVIWNLPYFRWTQLLLLWSQLPQKKGAAQGAAVSEHLYIQSHLAKKFFVQRPPPCNQIHRTCHRQWCLQSLPALQKKHPIFWGEFLLTGHWHCLKTTT